MISNKRRFVKTIIILIVFILGTIHTDAQNIYEVVSNSKLNIRELPSPTSKVLGTLHPKATIQVIKFIDAWAEFNYKGQCAYVFSKYIVKKETNEEIKLFKVVSESNLNVRLQPSTNAQVLGTLQPEEQIEVLSNDGNWAKINYKNNIGYVSAKYIQEIEKGHNISFTQSKTEKEIIHTQSENYDNSTHEELYTIYDSDYIFERIRIEFVPNAYCGLSNFSSSDVTPKGTIGGGLDLALQFIAKEDIAFIPKDYFMEASLGYSLKGSAAFPMHYINLKVLPFGYRYNLSEYTLFGKLGIYAGYPLSSIKTNKNSFDSNIDVGLTIGVGAEYKNIGLGISYEQGGTNVCNSKLKLKNQGIFVNVSYRLLSLK